MPRRRLAFAAARTVGGAKAALYVPVMIVAAFTAAVLKSAADGGAPDFPVFLVAAAAYGSLLAGLWTVAVVWTAARPRAVRTVAKTTDALEIAVFVVPMALTVGTGSGTDAGRALAAFLDLSADTVLTRPGLLAVSAATAATASLWAARTAGLRAGGASAPERVKKSRRPKSRR